MYEKNNKRKIYQLIDTYLSGEINESIFCHEFYVTYDLELDHDTLNADEYRAFYDLSEITSRFSEFEKDIKEHPGVYHTKEEVKKKVLETRYNLEKRFKELKESGDIDNKPI